MRIAEVARAGSRHWLSRYPVFWTSSSSCVHPVGALATYREAVYELRAGEVLGGAGGEGLTGTGSPTFCTTVVVRTTTVFVPPQPARHIPTVVATIRTAQEKRR